MDHYQERIVLLNNLPYDEGPMLVSHAIDILERAMDVELHDPDPIDVEIGFDEPNWLLRIERDFPDGFELL